jgi:hypothetical protein
VYVFVNVFAYMFVYDNVPICLSFYVNVNYVLVNTVGEYEYARVCTGVC